MIMSPLGSPINSNLQIRMWKSNKRRQSDGRNEVGNIEGNNSGSENDLEDGSSTQTEIKELSEGNDNPKENTIRSKDKIAPKIINLKPNYGTINIPLTSAIEASFNEPVQKATIGPSTFLVKIPDGSMFSE